jgi:hypothetical protein
MLNKLEALAKAATPGPWSSDGTCVDAENEIIADAKPFDAAYIAAANPETILRLIELLKEMGEALQRTVDQHLITEDDGNYIYEDMVLAALAKYKEMAK